MQLPLFKIAWRVSSGLLGVAFPRLWWQPGVVHTAQLRCSAWNLSAAFLCREATSVTPLLPKKGPAKPTCFPIFPSHHEYKLLSNPLKRKYVVSSDPGIVSCALRTTNDTDLVLLSFFLANSCFISCLACLCATPVLFVEILPLACEF